MQVDEVAMGLLTECPKCGYWNSANSLDCKGIFRPGINKGQHCKVGNLRRIPDKEYLIEYRSSDGKKIRARVGSNRNDAELRLLNRTAIPRQLRQYQLLNPLKIFCRSTKAFGTDQWINIPMLAPTLIQVSQV